MPVDTTHFFKQVYLVVRKIPRGRVSTYGSIAEYIGAKQSARMVGWAMNQCHREFPPVPAHRVLNRNGQLTGKHHFSYPEQMQELLENEGVIVKNDVVVDFKNIFWNPNTELL